MNGAANTGSGPSGVSVLVLTKNDEANIAECLQSLSFSDDIVVLDAFSTDRTVEIARGFPNIRVEQRAFDADHSQRNHGLHAISYKHAWVYICDADERVPADLRDELVRTAADGNVTHAAYRLRCKNFFLGRWIKRSTGYPTWVTRLVKPGQVRFEKQFPDAHIVVQGTTGNLNAHFMHYPFSVGLRRWCDGINLAADEEVLETVAIRRSGSRRVGPLPTSNDPMGRPSSKKLTFLKARAFWRFMWMYFYRLGVLDGIPGFHYCAMSSMYEYWIEMKVIEHECQWREGTERIVTQRLAAPKGARA